MLSLYVPLSPFSAFSALYNPVLGYEVVVTVYALSAVFADQSGFHLGRAIAGIVPLGAL